MERKAILFVKNLPLDDIQGAFFEVLLHGFSWKYNSLPISFLDYNPVSPNLSGFMSSFNPDIVLQLTSHRFDFELKNRMYDHLRAFGKPILYVDDYDRCSPVQIFPGDRSFNLKEFVQKDSDPRLPLSQTLDQLLGGVPLN